MSIQVWEGDGVDPGTRASLRCCRVKVCKIPTYLYAADKNEPGYVTADKTTYSVILMNAALFTEKEAHTLKQDWEGLGYNVLIVDITKI